MLRGLYSLGWFFGIPLALTYLLYRSIRQPAYRRHWGERFGFLQPPPEGVRQLWIHAVSVGETAAAAPLVRRLAARFPQALVLLTHATPTGRDAGRELLRDLGPRLRQSYLPYDLPFCVGRFLSVQQPTCGLIMETEVWPNLMHAARIRGTPMAVINARLSEKSLARGLRYRGLIAPAIEAFDVIVAQTPTDSARVARLARPADAVVGNLKFDQAVSPAARLCGKAWRGRLGSRPIILAASTRDGEEALLLRSWRSRRPGIEDALLIIVPRHPNRFETVAALIAAAMPERRLMRRAALDQADADPGHCDILLGDSMGEMQNWYACADVAIMGGSLLPFGSQNLIEANALGCPVVLGQSIFNFEEAAVQSVAAGAAVQVADSGAAVAAALDIALDAERRAGMSKAALDFAQAHRGATDRT
ncbi:MAG: 3-deoxy-D-manno-octulosonic acid transferase, partial [Lautropia sp.]|nr:3-deoxy-D-manno-octulosonic acid transferase [Lautropia sp.]